jgi:hypothetical protein
MECLKRLGKYVVLALAFFCSIDRLDYNQEAIVNICLLAFIIICAIIASLVVTRFSTAFSAVSWRSATALTVFDGGAVYINHRCPSLKSPVLMLTVASVSQCREPVDGL